MSLMHEEKALFDKLLQTAVILCSQSIEDEEDNLGEIFVDGTSNILSKSDFADLERLRELLRTIGEKSRLMQILNECVVLRQLGARSGPGSDRERKFDPVASKLHAYYRALSYRRQLGNGNFERTRPDPDRIRENDIDRQLCRAYPGKNDGRKDLK